MLDALVLILCQHKSTHLGGEQRLVCRWSRTYLGLGRLRLENLLGLLGILSRHLLIDLGRSTRIWQHNTLNICGNVKNEG